MVISCEAGGDGVPETLLAARGGTGSRRWTLPDGGSTQLSSDQFARYAAERMAGQLAARLIINPYSMDLIDVTRSLRHRQLFPAATRCWPEEQRRQLIELVYAPYRSRLQGAIRSLLQCRTCVIHLSVRTFPPRSNGSLLRADVGLSYDTSAGDEVDMCLDWIDEMYDFLPMLRVRRNYPRRGTADNITRAMRKEFGGQYMGVEVMLNRAWVSRPLAIRHEVIDGICRALRTITELDQTEAA
jgi:predicted N-formylglutamate amidohydrolase